MKDVISSTYKIIQIQIVRKFARQLNCGLPFVDNLLYYEQTKNPNFRIESDEEQKMNDEPYVDLNNECYCQE